MQRSQSQADTRNGIASFSISGGKFEGLILIGLLATGAFDLVMYADMAITGIPLNIPSTLGELAVGEHEYAEVIGRLIHFGNGIGLSLIFGYVALPISKRVAKLPTMVYGIAFAVVELVVAVWFGMLPAIGAGIAGLDIAPEVPIMTLARHVAFGIVLGISVRRWN